MTDMLHNVEKLTRSGSTLYLAHIPGIGMEWTAEAEDAFEFDDIDEAQADANAYGGEVCSYQRPFSRRLPASAPTITLIAAE
ncbi:hypothetical protein ACK9YZ_06865 [Rhizobium sp. ZK1]|uniref:hypothetical protein n=1 Tax=Rhizobium sp. ZK1 TaxID=3389872 RepID=UPI0039F70FB9